MIQLTKRGEEVEIQLQSPFPCILHTSLTDGDLRRLGRRLIWFSRGLPWRFNWSADAKASWGSFKLELNANHRINGIQMRVAYEHWHEQYELVSECESLYGGISREAVLEFGKQLKSFAKSGSAVLYDGAPLSDNPFYDEYNKSH